MVDIKTDNIKLNPLMDTLRLQKLEDEIYFSEKYSEYISNSRLGLLQKQGPKAFFDGFGAQIGFNPSFALGSYVHELTLQPELFELAPDLKKPTAKLGAMADFLYKSYLEHKVVPNDDILQASEKIDYYRGKMTEERFDFVRGNCFEYWENRQLFEANHKTDKTIEYADTKTMETVNGCVNALHSNNNVMDLLHPTDITGQPIISENEQAILLDVEVSIENEEPFIVRLKSKLDNYTIDLQTQTFTVNDVKTTIKDTRQFNDVIQMYNYQRELAMYSFLGVLCCKKFYNIDNPTVKGNFLVVSTIAPYYTTTVPMTDKLFKEGFKQFKDLLRLACYYKKYGYEE